MELDKVIDIKANYKFIKASNDALSNIFCEIWGLDLKTAKDQILGKIAKGDKSIILFLTQHLKNYTGKYKNMLSISEDHNLIPNTYRNEYAKIIAGVTTSFTGEANYIALGSNATASSLTDVGLGTEFVRGGFTDRSTINNIAYLDKFFGTSDVGGQVVREVGIFADGTGTANSGYLMSKINVNESMSTNETLTINVSITLTSAT